MVVGGELATGERSPNSPAFLERPEMTKSHNAMHVVETPDAIYMMTSGSPRSVSNQAKRFELMMYAATGSILTDGAIAIRLIRPSRKPVLPTFSYLSAVPSRYR